MTVRIEHLVVDRAPDSWLRAPADGTDITDDETYRFDLLAMVRHILRDEPCDIVPVVVGAVIHPTNEFGHDLQVEVTYSRRGYRAIFAGTRVESGLANVQCYMD